MKKTLRIPLKLTKEEEALLNNFFLLPGWQFEALIGHKCTELSKQLIYRENGNPQYAITYGLNAVYENSNKPCIANFFILFGSRVFQSSAIAIVVKIPDLLKREYNWEEYQYKLWKQKDDIKKSELKTKVKKVNLAPIKVA